MIREIRHVLAGVWTLAAVLAAGPAGAEEKVEVGGLVRHSIMVPLIDRTSKAIVKTVPVIIEVHATTDGAKNFLTDRMASVQDAYIQATYGKTFTDVDYGSLSHALEDAVDEIAGDEYKGQYTISIQVNVKPK